MIVHNVKIERIVQEGETIEVWAVGVADDGDTIHFPVIASHYISLYARIANVLTNGARDLDGTDIPYVLSKDRRMYQR